MLDGGGFVPEALLRRFAGDIRHFVLETIDQADIIARQQTQRSTRLHIRRPRCQIMTRLQIDIAGTHDLAAHFAGLALFAVIVGVAHFVVG
ncbi:hypothetical protein D3C85_674030 [compost metagenome]